jgi:hypothetical protein
MDTTVGANLSLAMQAEMQMGVFTVLKIGPLSGRSELSIYWKGKGGQPCPSLDPQGSHCPFSVPQLAEYLDAM